MRSRVEIEKICNERLDLWKKDIVDAEATPFVLVSIAHNENIGKIHLCLLEDVDIEQVIKIMEGVVIELKKL